MAERGSKAHNQRKRKHGKQEQNKNRPALPITLSVGFCKKLIVLQLHTVTSFQEPICRQHPTLRAAQAALALD